MDSNVKIKKKARAESISLWKIAAQAGVSENTLLRWLRAPLEGERLERVTAALQRLIEQERGGENHD